MHQQRRGAALDQRSHRVRGGVQPRAGRARRSVAHRKFDLLEPLSCGGVVACDTVNRARLALRHRAVDHTLHAAAVELPR
eukprot:6213242-Prymnesium_polylepis.2